MVGGHALHQRIGEWDTFGMVPTARDGGRTMEHGGGFHIRISRVRGQRGYSKGNGFVTNMFSRSLLAGESNLGCLMTVLDRATMSSYRSEPQSFLRARETDEKSGDSF